MHEIFENYLQRNTVRSKKDQTKYVAQKRDEKKSLQKIY